MKNKTHELLRYALPAVVENILQTSLGFVDGLLIAKISLVAVSAVSLVNGIMAVYQAVFIALAVAVATVISNSIGAKKTTARSDAIHDAVLLALLLGLVLSLFSLLFAQPILWALGARGALWQQGCLFFRVVAGSSILMVLMTVLGQLIRTADRPKTPMVINLVVNLLNFVLDLLLIFGYFGLPKLGVLGVGIGTALARLVGVGLLFYQLQKTPHRITAAIMRRQTSVFRSDIVKRALPIMGERLMMRLGDVLIFALIIAYGTKVFAGNSIGETLTAYNYLPAFGFATGVSILIGRAFGAKDQAQVQVLTRQSLVITAVVSTVLGGLIFALSPMMLHFFTQDPTAIAAARIVVLISFVSEPIVSGVIIYTAALQATGDAKSPFYITMAGMWVIRIGLAWLLGTRLGLGLLGVWLATILDNLFRVIVLKLRYERRIRN
ncbi:MAG: MATE family efflux transporter [Streptococcaceae bacterium]|jgi:putative MATE family efflux protein|nr:MATE family efflux transporter [Streptococcaceae bacterium]